MASYCSCKKCLKSTYEIIFAVSGGWNSVTCTWNKVLYKRDVLRNFSVFSDKHKEHPEVFCQKMFLKIL